MSKAFIATEQKPAHAATQGCRLAGTPPYCPYTLSDSVVDELIGNVEPRLTVSIVGTNRRDHTPATRKAPLTYRGERGGLCRKRPVGRVSPYCRRVVNAQPDPK